MQSRSNKPCSRVAFVVSSEQLLFNFRFIQMLGKQAKILSARDVADLLAFADCSRSPLRNRVLVLLSTKAGLRAGEIAA